MTSRTALLASLCWLAAACGNDPKEQAPVPDGGPGGLNGRSCLAATCPQKGYQCGTADDGCGGKLQCGECVAPEVCGAGGVPNRCGCAAESAEELCAAHGLTCDPVELIDRCGVHRTVDCGTCAAGHTCGGGGTPNVCGCAAETDVAFCLRRNSECGAITAQDKCGLDRTVPCGECEDPETCGGGGIPNVCGCEAESDEELCSIDGERCDVIRVSDSCGAERVVDCGDCAAPEVCGGGGVPNVCGVACRPETDAAMCARLGKDCGPMRAADNCGVFRSVTCGVCDSPETCGGAGVANVCGAACVPESDPVFCVRLGKECDLVRAFDNCGAVREVDCGDCLAPETCGGAGEPNVCGFGGCTSESDEQFCARLGKNCGQVSDRDNCGAWRTESCGGCGSAGCTCLDGLRAETSCADGADNDGDGQKDCGDADCAAAAACTATLADGQACSQDSQCKSGWCWEEAETGMPKGYCSGPCTTAGATCPGGGVCAVDGDQRMCMARCGCDGRANCGCRTGYRCTQDWADHTGSASADVCTAQCTSDASCGTVATGVGCNRWTGRCGVKDQGLARTGAPCSTNSQCESGVCYSAESGMPGGYCASFCNAENDVCPAGDVCIKTTGTAADGVCLDGCSSSADCRQSSNYGCAQSVADPTKQVCWPICGVYGSDCAAPSECCSNICDASTGTCR